VSPAGAGTPVGAAHHTVSAVSTGAASTGTASTTTFGDRLQAAFDGFGRLCVGIDPHSWLLSQWWLPPPAGRAS
jgi:hypothetical protein